MGSSVRAGPDSSQTATPLTTGFLIYLKFLLVFKEEKKKGNHSTALTALL